MSVLTREQKLSRLWKITNPELKTTFNGLKCVMICRQGVTTLVPLDDLTNDEISHIVLQG